MVAGSRPGVGWSGARVGRGPGDGDGDGDGVGGRPRPWMVGRPGGRGNCLPAGCVGMMRARAAPGRFAPCPVAADPPEPVAWHPRAPGSPLRAAARRGGGRSWRRRRRSGSRSPRTARSGPAANDMTAGIQRQATTPNASEASTSGERVRAKGDLSRHRTDHAGGPRGAGPGRPRQRRRRPVGRGPHRPAGGAGSSGSTASTTVVTGRRTTAERNIGATSGGS